MKRVIVKTKNDLPVIDVSDLISPQGLVVRAPSGEAGIVKPLSIGGYYIQWQSGGESETCSSIANLITHYPKFEFFQL